MIHQLVLVYFGFSTWKFHVLQLFIFFVGVFVVTWLCWLNITTWLSETENKEGPKKWEAEEWLKS